MNHRIPLSPDCPLCDDIAVLTLYRRHAPPCKYTSRRFRTCKCPIWVQGSLRGEYLRRSLDLRSWEAASDLVRGWDASGEIGVVKPEAPTVKEAVGRFFEDAETRGLKPATIAKYRVLLEKQLLPWCRSKGYARLKQLTVDELTRFRSSWPDGPLSMRKKQERMAAFFHFCKQREWIKSNPVMSIKLPEVTPSPTLPFEPEEIEKILEGCDRFPIKGIYGEGNRKRLRAMVLLLRYSGMRIGDCVSLRKHRLQDGKLNLRTEKTGTLVWIPLPDFVVKALHDVPDLGTEFFFWSGEGLLKSAVADWQRSLRRLFTMVGIKDAHAHRFRDTFSCQLLEAGVPVEDVAILLGHSSPQVTAKHYSPWIQSRQARLSERVATAWGLGGGTPSRS